MPESKVTRIIYALGALAIASAIDSSSSDYSHESSLLHFIQALAACRRDPSGIVGLCAALSGPSIIYSTMQLVLSLFAAAALFATAAAQLAPTASPTYLSTPTFMTELQQASISTTDLPQIRSRLRLLCFALNSDVLDAEAHVPRHFARLYLPYGESFLLHHDPSCHTRSTLPDRAAL